jgi:5,6,7,8-tetrahydromethanopterin hydro-lyase
MDRNSFLIGESLIGDGNEVAHVDLVIGHKTGPAGAAFVQRLNTQTAGHNALLALLAPNVPAKPDTVMYNKVTIKGATQAVQMFGPAQAGVAKAVVDSVADGTIPKAEANDLCVAVGVFIHWEAKDGKKIYDYNYRATKEAIQRAMKNQPTVDAVIGQKDTAKHPFA